MQVAIGVICTLFGVMIGALYMTSPGVLGGMLGASFLVFAYVEWVIARSEL